MPGADDLSLSQSYFPQSVTTPAGTAKASPLTTIVAVPPALLIEVYVLIPRGHAGQTGLQVVYSGATIVPFGGASADQWIVGDGDALTLPVSFPVASKLTVRTFNTGIFDHTHYVRFKVDYNALTQSGTRRNLAIVPTD